MVIADRGPVGPAPSGTPPSKACTGCMEFKPINMFDRRKDAKDGRASACIACRKAKAAAYRTANRERLRQTAKEYREGYRTNGPTVERDHKACCECGETKPTAAFYRDRSRADGLRRMCRGCDRARRVRPDSERRLITDDAYLERGRRRYERKGGRKSKLCGGCGLTKPTAEFHRNRRHPDGLATYCKDCTARYRREYYEGNRNRFIGYGRKRRARLAGADGNFTGRQWECLLDFYEGTCLCCGASAKITVDHVVPLVLGGSNRINNLQPLCSRCNSSKGIRVIDYRDPHLHGELLEAMRATGLLAA